MKRYENYAALAARLALAAIFIYSGFGKLDAPEATAAYIGTTSLPVPYFVGVIAGLTELVGGLALAAGVLTRWAAIGLVLFLIPATAFFHNPMGLEGAAAHAAVVQLYKNLAIAGGLLAISAIGAGALTLTSFVGFGSPRAARGPDWAGSEPLESAQRTSR